MLLLAQRFYREFCDLTSVPKKLGIKELIQMNMKSHFGLSISFRPGFPHSIIIIQIQASVRRYLHKSVVDNRNWLLFAKHFERMRSDVF